MIVRLDTDSLFAAWSWWSPINSTDLACFERGIFTPGSFGLYCKWWILCIVDDTLQKYTQRRFGQRNNWWIKCIVMNHCISTPVKDCIMPYCWWPTANIHLSKIEYCTCLCVLYPGFGPDKFQRIKYCLNKGWANDEKERSTRQMSKTIKKS